VGYSPFSQGGVPSPDTKAGRVLADVAADLGATPHQVALAFLVRRPSLFCIPMSAQPVHLLQNAAAGRWPWRAGSRPARGGVPPGPRRPGVAMV